MPETTHQGRRISYSVTQADTGEPASKAPVILIPGLGSGRRLFGTLHRRFAKMGHPCLVYDPVGIPPSDPHSGVFDLTLAGQDVWALADAAGWDQVHLVGTSLGGKVALSAAHQAQERTHRLVLLASSVVESARAKSVYRYFAAIAEHLPGPSIGAATAPFLFGKSFHERRPQVVTDAARAVQPDAGVRALMVAQAECLQSYVGTELARAVDIPTLCVAGEEDTLTDAEDVAATAALFPQGQLLRSPHAGHSLLLEDPGVLERVLGFLDG